ncbi:MAG: 3-hydroxyacyl-CoA dehydrogenase NAD-binding domain-containing protein [Pseudomonadales bacterium]
MAKTAAVVGCGTIGAGWVARLLLNGCSVKAYDANPASLRALSGVLEQARISSIALNERSAPEGELTLCENLEQCLADAELVLESLPENLASKKQLYAQAENHISPTCWLLSSTSGFKPTDLASDLRHPERFLVCHPFNPVYLIPLVEVVPHAMCTEASRQQCLDFLRDLDMQPLLVRKEIDGHIADRLLEAMWREALWLVHDEIATTEEIDAAIKGGFGLRMAQMGLFETYRLGGGDGGFASFLEQFGPALKWPWSHLTEVPDLDQALIRKIVSQSDAQTGDASHAQRVRDRDRKLVAILRALRDS